MFLLYHAYVYLEFLILACTIYILAPMMINIGEILHMDMLGITDQVREFEEQIDKNYGKDDSANGKVKKKIEKLIINND